MEAWSAIVVLCPRVAFPRCLLIVVLCPRVASPPRCLPPALPPALPPYRLLPPLPAVARRSEDLKCYVPSLTSLISLIPRLTTFKDSKV